MSSFPSMVCPDCSRRIFGRFNTDGRGNLIEEFPTCRCQREVQRRPIPRQDPAPDLAETKPSNIDDESMATTEVQVRDYDPKDARMRKEVLEAALRYKESGGDSTDGLAAFVLQELGVRLTSNQAQWIRFGKLRRVAKDKPQEKRATKEAPARPAKPEATEPKPEATEPKPAIAWMEPEPPNHLQLVQVHQGWTLSARMHFTDLARALHAMEALSGAIAYPTEAQSVAASD